MKGKQFQERRYSVCNFHKRPLALHRYYQISLSVELIQIGTSDWNYSYFNNLLLTRLDITTLSAFLHESVIIFLAEVDHVLFGSVKVIVARETCFDPVRKMVSNAWLAVAPIAEENKGRVVTMSYRSTNALG